MKKSFNDAVKTIFATLALTSPFYMAPILSLDLMNREDNDNIRKLDAQAKVMLVNEQGYTLESVDFHFLTTDPVSGIYTASRNDSLFEVRTSMDKSHTDSRITAVKFQGMKKTI